MIENSISKPQKRRLPSAFRKGSRIQKNGSNIWEVVDDNSHCSQSMTTKSKTEQKRESQNLISLYQSFLIGMLVVLGCAVTVSYPSKTTKMTKPTFIINSVTENGRIVFKGSEKKDENMASSMTFIEEMLQEKQFEIKWKPGKQKAKFKSKRINMIIGNVNYDQSRIRDVGQKVNETIVNFLASPHSNKRNKTVTLDSVNCSEIIDLYE